jgi:hypothetical protein
MVARADDDDYLQFDDLFEGRETLFRKNGVAISFEQAQLDTPLPDENRGMKLLYKMGWTKDKGLGKDGTGTLRGCLGHSHPLGLALWSCSRPVEQVSPCRSNWWTPAWGSGSASRRQVQAA